ncbi:MAG: hypothetical protein M3083_00535 [Actinomycetota bacterium]|nr:hypothetical protein [Actinomycetota bacterium]
MWHDRAVFHFLVAPDNRARYHRLITDAVAPGGFVVVGTFAADGPQHCSGLPVCATASMSCGLRSETTWNS